MKKWILLFICAINAMASIGQNVGIGTDEPQEKLDVNGGIQALHLNLTGTSGDTVEILDQQQLLFNGYTSDNTPGWQSFTANKSGILSMIQLNHFNPISTTMSIYQGEGQTNELLGIADYSSAGSGWGATSPISIPVVEGQKYTIYMSNIQDWMSTNENPYLGGISSIGPVEDMTFKTYVKIASSFHVDNLGNVYINGDIRVNGGINVEDYLTADNLQVTGNLTLEGDMILNTGKLAIGTNNPLTKLHLSGVDGRVRIDGGSGTGPYFSLGGEGKFEVDAPGVFGGRLVILNNGDIGIGNPSPSCKLDVTGNTNITGNLLLSGINGKIRIDGGSGTGPYFSLGEEGKIEVDAPEVPGGRLTILNNGNTGIGNPSPSCKLDVAGYARISERLGIGTSSPASSLHIKSNETNSNTFGILASGGLSGNAMIEMRSNGGTPYLDFTNDSIIDFDGRLILVSDNRIQLEGADLYVNSNPVYATAFNVTSDQRLKKDIEEVHFPISEIDEMKVYNYHYIESSQSYSFPETLQTGLMAQEVELVYPHAVTTDSEGFKAIDYGKLTPLLLDYIKQLKAENDSLKNDLESLKKDIEWIKSQL